MKTLYILITSLIFSCNQKDKIPKGVLEKDKMQAVLWDVLQADEFLKDYVLNKDSTLNDTTESVYLYQKVFDFHKTTREVFDSSFNYYRMRPLLMKEILDSLHSKSQLTGAPTPIYEGNDSLPKIFRDSGSVLPRIKKALKPD